MKVLIIDNKDSFTYNLYHYVEQFARDVDVYRANSISLQQVGKYDKIIFSPGPGLPSEHEIMFKILDKYKDDMDYTDFANGEIRNDRNTESNKVNLNRDNAQKLIDILINSITD